VLNKGGGAKEKREWEWALKQSHRAYGTAI